MAAASAPQERRPLPRLCSMTPSGASSAGESTLMRAWSRAGRPCLEMATVARSSHGAARVKTSWLIVAFDTTLKITRSGWHGNLLSKNLLYALTLDGLLQSAVPLGSRVSLTYRLVAPVSKTTSAPATPWRAYHIFMRGGAPTAHGA
jgi:hypothetical protein